MPYISLDVRGELQLRRHHEVLGVRTIVASGTPIGASNQQYDRPGTATSLPPSTRTPYHIGPNICCADELGVSASLSRPILRPRHYSRARG